MRKLSFSLCIERAPVVVAVFLCARVFSELRETQYLSVVAASGVAMAGTTVVPPGRQHKRTVSDQQKRRELALQRQKQGRRDLQHHARQLALSTPNESGDAYGEQHEEFVENEVKHSIDFAGNFF